MAIKLLLIEDVEDLGRSGDIVNVKPGYARNFLVPNQLGIPADKQALKMQTRLQEERTQRAQVERQEAEKMAHSLDGVVVSSIVKVDHEGNMYGSVTVHDILELLKSQCNLALEKKSIALNHPIKTIGVHKIPVKLKEGITSSITLKVMTEEGLQEEPLQA